jgi:hypothetical protein
MSRSGYSEDCDNVQLWRTAVARATYGKRGQALLRDMLAALDALPVKRLTRGELVTADGECCALGAVAIARSMDVSDLDPDERGDVALAFDIAPALAAEIAYENDERGAGQYGNYDAQGRYVPPQGETPEKRWERMRAWVAAQLKEPS